MPRERIYASNADRQAAYNERKREAERQRQAAIRAEGARQARLRDNAKRAAAAIICKANEFGYTDRFGLVLGDTPDEAQEVRAIIDSLAAELMRTKRIA